MNLPFTKHKTLDDIEFYDDDEMYEDGAPSRIWDEEDPTDSRFSLILAFVLPVVIMLGILAGKEIYPFGNNSFLRTDMYHQYAPFFAEFCRTLKNGGSLTYSFEIGLGTNFQALYAYYLASPLNWLVFFIPESLIIEFMTYTIVLKIGMCGFSLAYYLRKRFNTRSLAVAFFGVSYALCGYIAAYSWNIMWMDSLWLAPLILLGLERLVREAKPFLYVITLGIAILCNYYIAIMICIFLVFYFICEMILLPDMTWTKFGVRAAQFAVFSLLAGGVAAILLIPAAKALMSTASADSTFPSSLTYYFGVVDMLARHMVVADVEIGLDHWPNIYSGVACFFLLPIYAISPKIPAKKKIVQFSLLAFMLLGFSMNIPNYIWHGMHYPNSLPCRQSFLYTIVLLAMCFEGLRKLRYLKKSQIAACLWGDIAFLLILQKLVDEPEIEWYCAYATIGFILLYVLMVWLWKSRKMQAMTAIAVCLVLVTAELGLNMAVTSVTTTNRDEYWRNTDNYQALIATAEEMEGDNFFRVEKDTRRTKNDGAWVGYNSASIFSSATEAGLSDIYKLFGLEGNTNAYSFTGATPLMESILSVRYKISSYELDTSELMEYVRWEDGAYLYHNIFTLPLGFMIPSDVDDYFTYYNGNDPAAAQNSLVSLTSGTGAVLDDVAIEDDLDEVSFDVPEEGHYYAYIGNRKVESVTVDNGSSEDSVDNVDRGFLVDLGTCYLGETVTITSDDGNNLNASVYRFNNENFIRWYEAMSKQAMTVTNVTNTLRETSITGTIHAATDNTLFLSIPYEDGWTVTVDGVETATDAFVDAFLSLDLTAGNHTIVLTYHTPGQTLGILLTLLSLVGIVLMAILFTVYGSVKRKLSLEKDEDEEEITETAAAVDDSAISGSGEESANADAADESTSEEGPARTELDLAELRAMTEELENESFMDDTPEDSVAHANAEALKKVSGSHASDTPDMAFELANGMTDEVFSADEVFLEDEDYLDPPSEDEN